MNHATNALISTSYRNSRSIATISNSINNNNNYCMNENDLTKMSFELLKIFRYEFDSYKKVNSIEISYFVFCVNLIQKLLD
jgi:hypothetical protein